MANELTPVLGLFASEQGPGDAERAALMSQLGSFLARKGARLVCLAEDGAAPMPLLTSARSAGGDVRLIAEADFAEPAGISGITVEHVDTREARLKRMSDLADVYVALPGSLASAADLYLTWVRGGGGEGRRPVVFYDHHDAFKVVRGYIADVVSTSVKGHDRLVQFATNPDDLWNKISHLVEQGATRLK